MARVSVNVDVEDDLEVTFGVEVEVEGEVELLVSSLSPVALVFFRCLSLIGVHA